MRPLSTTNSTGTASAITRPVYLVEIMLSTPVRVSSRETTTLRGNSFTAGSVRVDLGGSRVAIFNDSLTASFLAATSGAAVRVFVLHGEGPFTDADADVLLEGEIGGVAVDEWITINVRQAPAKRLPRLYVGPPTFNHLPPDGLRINTLSGVYVLRRGD